MNAGRRCMQGQRRGERRAWIRHTRSAGEVATTHNTTHHTLKTINTQRETARVVGRRVLGRRLLHRVWPQEEGGARRRARGGRGGQGVMV